MISLLIPIVLRHAGWTAFLKFLYLNNLGDLNWYFQLFSRNGRTQKKSNSIPRPCDDNEFEKKNIEENQRNHKFGQTETS